MELTQLLTSQMQVAFTVIIVMLAILYVLSIIWVIRDAYLRGTTWYIWGLVALVPFIGVIAYLLMRPPLLQIDRDEQELEILLKQRQLMQYGECATCGYPVEVNYIVCPNCLSQLKNQCTHCSRALEPAWTVCPYCATPVHSNSEPSPRKKRRRSGRKSQNISENLSESGSAVSEVSLSSDDKSASGKDTSGSTASGPSGKTSSSEKVSSEPAKARS